MTLTQTPQDDRDARAREFKDRGAALLAKGKLDGALAEYERAVQLSPRDVVARRKVAEVLARLGRSHDAVVAYQLLAGRFAAEGRFLEAIALCKVVLQLEPQHVETQSTLSRLYAQRDSSPGRLVERLPPSMSGAVDLTHSRAAQAALPKPRLGLPGAPAGDSHGDLDPLLLSDADEHVGVGARAGSAPPSTQPSSRGAQRTSPGATRTAPGAVRNTVTSSSAHGFNDGPGVELDVTELPSTPLFSELPEDVMQALLERLTMLPFTEGEQIIAEGEIGRSLFVVASGSAQVVRKNASGAQVVIDKMPQGTFFGEIGLVADVPRLATVIATEDCVVLEVSRAMIAELNKKFPFLDDLVRSFYKTRLLQNLLRQSPLFAPLTPAERAAVVDKFIVRTARPGETLLKQGEEGRGLFLLLRGRCGVSFRDNGGAEHTLPEMGEGAVMGEISLINGTAVTATVTALTQSVLLFLEPAPFVEYLLSNPGARDLMTRLSNERLQRTDAIEEQAAFEPSLL